MKTALIVIFLCACAPVPAKTADIQQCIMQAVGKTEQGYMVVNMACVGVEK